MYRIDDIDLRKLFSRREIVQGNLVFGVHQNHYVVFEQHKVAEKTQLQTLLQQFKNNPIAGATYSQSQQNSNIYHAEQLQKKLKLRQREQNQEQTNNLHCSSISDTQVQESNFSVIINRSRVQVNHQLALLRNDRQKLVKRALLLRDKINDLRGFN